MTAGYAAMTNGEFSVSSTSSAQPVSYVSGRSTDAGANVTSGSGSVSSESVPYNSTPTDNNAWNDRPTSVHTGYAAEPPSYQYSSVVPPSQRRPHSNDVQEYDSLPFDSVLFSFCFLLLQFLIILIIIITSVHQCHCGASVDALGLHSFVCKKVPGRPARHHAVNDLVAWDMASAGILVSMELQGLSCSDGKWPDGLSLIPWQAVKPLTWDVTVVCLLAVAAAAAEK